MISILTGKYAFSILLNTIQFYRLRKLQHLMDDKLSSTNETIRCQEMENFRNLLATKLSTDVLDDSCLRAANHSTSIIDRLSPQLSKQTSNDAVVRVVNVKSKRLKRGRRRLPKSVVDDECKGTITVNSNEEENSDASSAPKKVKRGRPRKVFY